MTEVFEPKSILTPKKLDFVLHWLGRTFANPRQRHDHIIEIGCYEGGTLKAIADDRASIGRKIIGFDTFEGLPRPHQEDLAGTSEPHHENDFATDCNKVSRYFASRGVAIVETYFPNGIEPFPVSFCHLDVDLHYPTLHSLEWLTKSLVHTGIVVVDDYGWHRTPGVKTAVDSFLKEHAEFVAVEQSGEYQIVLKRGRIQW